MVPPQLGAEPCVLPRLQHPELTLELAVAREPLRRERPAVDRRGHRAAGLGLVRAVGEAALQRQRLDVLERLPHPLAGLPELELAQAGRVEDEPAAREQVELAARRRVPAAAVPARLAGLERGLAEQRVHDRRLADAGRAEQACRPAVREVRADVVEPAALRHRDRVDGDAERDRLDLGDRSLDVVAEVGLRQQDHRLGAALPGGREVALEAARVEVVRERGRQEGDVDVGGEHLLLGAVPGGLARDRAAACQHGVDDGASALLGRVVGDPVADGGQVGAGLARVEPEPAGGLGPALVVVRGEEDVGAAVLGRDAPGLEARVFQVVELVPAAGIPAEPCEAGVCQGGQAISSDSVGAGGCPPGPEQIASARARSPGRGGAELDLRIGSLHRLVTSRSCVAVRPH